MTPTKKKVSKPQEKDLAPIETNLHDLQAIISESTLEKALATPKAQQLFNALTGFVQLDYEAEQQSTTAGEVFTKILALPLTLQQKLVFAMADAKGVPRPEYKTSGVGRPTKGRNELAAVLYSAYPDMLEKDHGKDTRGAKRITDHMRRYQIRLQRPQIEGGRSAESQEEKENTSVVPERALKTVFKLLWAVAKNNTEKQAAVNMYMRLGINVEQMDKWVEHKLLTLVIAAPDDEPQQSAS